MDAFSRFRTLNTLSQIETLLAPYQQLEGFEKAQLGTSTPLALPHLQYGIANTRITVTLCPGDPEEAKVLIPSLVNKLSDDVLKDLLEQIDQQRQFHED
jgi:hypothetical protein